MVVEKSDTVIGAKWHYRKRQFVMTWTVIDIAESDFGCEERMPGEPLMVMVSLECEDGRIAQFEMPDEWLTSQGIDVGDEWPEDIDNPEGAAEEAEKAENMADFMQNFFDALQEMKDADK